MSGRNKKVRVFLRTRPTANFAHDLIDLEPDAKAVNIHCKRDERRGIVNNQVLDWSFKVDGVLHNASQESVYQTCATNIVSKALDGINGTVMCYGQTGAGKTFSMTGATENYQHRGLLPRALAQLYQEVEERADNSITIRISYLEIYNETMTDLLSTLPDTVAPPTCPLTVVEDQDGSYVKGLGCHLAPTEEDALNLLFEGETNRAIAAHALNKVSSRSHCIFTVYIQNRSRVESDATYTISKINFVDLAGSERLGKTNSEGRTKEEAMYINKSLSFLEQTVIALANRRRDHVPYRHTKLTHCLRDAIGGNCSTVLIANIWAEAAQLEETISTLRFATRMMCISNEPCVNKLHDPAVMVKKLQSEISSLKRELAMHDTLTNRSQITYEPLSEQQRYEIRQQVTAYTAGGLQEIDIVNIRQIQGVFEAFKTLCNQMERDIEDRLRAKYTLVDRTDPAAIAAAQQAGLPIGDDGELVGQSDGSNFGIGTAPATSAATKSSVIASRKKDARKGKSSQRSNSPGGPKPQSPAHSGKATDPSVAPTPSGDDNRPATPSSVTDESKRLPPPRPRYVCHITGKTQVCVSYNWPATPSSVTDESKRLPPPRPSTPPPRTEAFEEFKQELGSEINRILNENKEILSAKKKAYSDLAKKINQTKEAIDTSRRTLDTLQAEREANGPLYNEDGDIIISEQEYVEIGQLKDLKASYRADHDSLRQTKQETVYCQKLVDQCRQKLIQEFDNWYSESFLSGVDTEPQTSADAGFGARSGVIGSSHNNMVEDEQEKFERLQMELLMENPDSASYYNAKIRTQRRKTYEKAMSQAQPRREIGTPRRIIRNQAPTMLQVQN